MNLNKSKKVYLEIKIDIAHHNRNRTKKEENKDYFIDYNIIALSSNLDKFTSYSESFYLIYLHYPFTLHSLVYVYDSPLSFLIVFHLKIVLSYQTLLITLYQSI